MVMVEAEGRMVWKLSRISSISLRLTCWRLVPGTEDRSEICTASSRLLPTLVVDFPSVAPPFSLYWRATFLKSEVMSWMHSSYTSSVLAVTLSRIQLVPDREYLRFGLIRDS